MKGTYRGYEYFSVEDGSFSVALNGRVIKSNLAHDEHAMDWIDQEKRRLRDEGKNDGR